MTNKRSLIDILKVVVSVVGVPLALFALIRNFTEQPVVALIVAGGIAFIISGWIVHSRWVGISEVLIGWLTLTVLVLVGFALWPNTMTVEGTVIERANVPMGNEKVILIDDYGITHETQTDTNGYYQFKSIPYGTYKIQARVQEVGGVTGGILPVPKCSCKSNRTNFNSYAN